MKRGVTIAPPHLTGGIPLECFLKNHQMMLFNQFNWFFTVWRLVTIQLLGKLPHILKISTYNTLRKITHSCRCHR